MSGGSPHSIITVVPAEAQSSRVLRAVASTAAAAADLSVDAIEDLGLAVTEAGGVLLRATTAPSWRLLVTPGDDGIELSVSAPAEIGEWPPGDFASSLAAGVLESLVADLEFAREDGSVAIHMTFAAVRRS